MQIEIIYLLAGISCFLTVLIPVLMKFPAESETAEGGLRGLALVASIFAFISWLATAASVATASYVYYYSDGALYYTYEYVYNNTWPLAWLFVGVSVIPLLLLIYLIPESWKDPR